MDEAAAYAITVAAKNVSSIILDKYFLTGAIVGGCCVYSIFSPRKIRTITTNTQRLLELDESNSDGKLDIRRMHQIVAGKPTDHAGQVMIMVDESFDINATIFKSITTKLIRYIQSDKLAIKLFWSDKVANSVRNAYEKIPKAPKYDKPILEFMDNECDFAMEHADGSFKDHLKFCYEYSHKHYQSKSARVLLLHSIMGVGTNFFPMKKEKIGALQALLTDFEFRQIAMFPSVLRLFYHGPLRYELENLVDSEEGKAKLKKLRFVEMHRVIDNEKIRVNAVDFWIQLNYQLMHLLDFLPATCWKEHTGDTFLDNFIAMHKILSKLDKLEARVDYDAREGQSSQGEQPVTLASLLRGCIPSNIQIALAQRQISGFSRAIGHSLQYKFVYD